MTNAEVAQVGAGRRLTLALTRTPEVVRDQERGSPPRLVLDLDGPRPAEPRQVTAFPLSDELVSRVRVGSFGGKLRAIVDLSHAPGPHAVRSEGAKVIVDLGDTSLAAAALARAARKRPGALGAAATPAVAAPVETPGAPPAGDTTPLAVRDVRVEPMGEGRRLVIELTRPPDDVHDFALSAPARLVMDLHGPLPAKPAVLTRFPLTDDMVTGVRVATNGGALRIVADLNHPARTHTVHQEGNRLVADLGDTGTAENVPAAHLMLVAEFENAAAAEAEFDGEPAAPPPPAEPPARVAAAEPEAKQPPPPAAEPEPAATPEPAPPPAHVASVPHAPPPAQPVRREMTFTGQRIRAAHPRAGRAEREGAERGQHRRGDARPGAPARGAVGLQPPGGPADREPARVELPRRGRHRRRGAERRLGARGDQRRGALAGPLHVRFPGEQRFRRLRGRKRVVSRPGARLARRGERARGPLDRAGAAGQG